MSTAAIPVAERRSRITPLRAVKDTLVIAERNLISYTRIPEALFFSSVQPIMFVLLFRYVFGGAIRVADPGGYVNYLIPGIFVQTVAFGAVQTSIGLAEDLQKGLIERFRSLPMARSGVAAVLLILMFAYSLSWGFAVIGLSAANSETAQVMSFPLLFPLTFASSAFVPVQSMPGWLQGFAKYQPVSEVIDAARGLMVGGVADVAGHVEISLVWSVGLLIVLAPLAVHKYRTRT